MRPTRGRHTGMQSEVSDFNGELLRDARQMWSSCGVVRQVALRPAAIAAAVPLSIQRPLQLAVRCFQGARSRASLTAQDRPPHERVRDPGRQRGGEAGDLGGVGGDAVGHTTRYGVRQDVERRARKRLNRPL